MGNSIILLYKGATQNVFFLWDNDGISLGPPHPISLIGTHLAALRCAPRRWPERVARYPVSTPPPHAPESGLPGVSARQTPSNYYYYYYYY